MEIRLAKQNELKRLKLIWKLCFGDEDWYIDFYFDHRDWLNETAVLLLEGEIVSMLSMIPVELIRNDGEKYHGAMLYAIATHPDFQKRGLAEKLIEFSNQHLLVRQIPVTLLVPAEEELFEFYRRRGYQEGFYLREAVLKSSKIEELIQRMSDKSCRIVPAEPHEYNTSRREFLDGSCYIGYRDEEISFQKKEAQLYQTDIYQIKSEDTVIGCAVIEKFKDRVIVKELLVPDHYLIPALKEIAELFPGDAYLVRTPPASGEALGGALRPFGMIKVNQQASRIHEVIPAYLGIAYD